MSDDDPTTTTETTIDTTVVSLTMKPHETHYTPIYVYTAFFGLMFILGPIFVRQGPNRSITRVCIMLTSVCCWIFWTTLYIAQMNPLLGPRLSNHSLAWIGHKWGDDASSLSSNTTGTTTPVPGGSGDSSTPTTPEEATTEGTESDDDG